MELKATTLGSFYNFWDFNPHPASVYLNNELYNSEGKIKEKKLF